METLHLSQWWSFFLLLIALSVTFSYFQLLSDTIHLSQWWSFFLLLIAPAALSTATNPAKSTIAARYARKERSSTQAAGSRGEAGRGAEEEEEEEAAER